MLGESLSDTGKFLLLGTCSSDYLLFSLDNSWSMTDPLFITRFGKASYVLINCLTLLMDWLLCLLKPPACEVVTFIIKIKIINFKMN